MITSLPRFVSNVVRIGSWNTVELFCFLCLLRRVFSVCLPLYKLHIPFRKVRVSSASQMTWKKMAETTEKRDVMSSCLTHDAKMTRETWRLKGKDEDDDDTHEEDGHEETWGRHSMKSCLLFLEEQSLFLTLTFLSPFLVLLPREADILLYYSSCKSCLTQCLNFLSWLLQKLEGVVSRQLVVSLGVSGHLRRHDSSLGHDGWHSSRLSHELLSHMDFYTLDVIYLWMYCLESLFWNKFTTDLLFWRDSHHRLRSHPQSHSLCLESSWLQ